MSVRECGRSARRGVTLLELLIVIVLIAFLLGLAVTMFRAANRDLGVRGAADYVVALLRAASDRGRAGSSPVEVVVDTEARSIFSLTQETAGMWHFEDDRGAFGSVATLSKVDAVPGYFGRAFAFTGGSTVTCGTLPVNAPDAGIAIDLYLQPSARVRAKGGRKQVVCGIVGEVELTLESNGQVGGRVGELAVDSGTTLLKAGDWYHVEMVYNTLEIRLYINEIEAGRKSGRGGWASKSPFIVGAHQSGFVGLIDEVRVALILPRDVYILPQETSFEFPPGTALRDKRWFTFWFDGRGRLDARHHQVGVTVTVKSPSEAKTIAVNTQGTVAR